MNLSAIEHNNNAKQRRQVYVPASMKVIKVTAQKVLCISGDTLNQYPGNSWDES